MSQDSGSRDTTHFGYQQVPKGEKRHRVAGVFSSVARKYDVMNDLMSMGVHRVWKRFTIERAGVRRGQRVLDLAGGTGDLAEAFARRVGPEGEVVLSDINAEMLECGRERLVNAGVVGNVDYIQADAEALPFPDHHFDRVTMAFGLRNVTDKEAALASIHRVLKPGGKLLVLEFSHPVMPGLKPIYDAYSFGALPLMGKLVANDADSYRYLAESIRMHPAQETLGGMFEAAGFEQVTWHNLSGGIVALHIGTKV
ncbi:MAG: bifunctional demethylmenaquinone methyltransferase/2-methoxy-6-polyprenyl-1,4-benzoquinol methylase UbiE [Pseudomonadota bacterium]